MHTASIFSETSFLLTAEPGYRVSSHPRSAQMRITMTGPLILAARMVLVPMLGERKLATARHLHVFAYAKYDAVETGHVVRAG